MATQKRSYIITISGASGSGKSTIAKMISERLQNSELIYFDAYQSSTNYPDPNDKTIQFDPRNIESPLFFADLCKLISGESIHDPWNRRLNPARFFIIDEPFGRLRREMSNMVDAVIYIDTPLDIALARRTIRNIDVDLKDHTSEEKLTIVMNNLKAYLNSLGDAYKTVGYELSRQCDITIDGTRSLDEVSNQVMDFILKRFT
jgi:uridine kinase